MPALIFWLGGLLAWATLCGQSAQKADSVPAGASLGQRLDRAAANRQDRAGHQPEEQFVQQDPEKQEEEKAQSDGFQPDLPVAARFRGENPREHGTRMLSVLSARHGPGVYRHANGIGRRAQPAQ